MRLFTAAIAALLVSPAFACPEEHRITSGTTLDARAANGRPLVSIEGVGGITIRHRGTASGAFTVTQECDAEHAARLRAQLERLLNHEDAFLR